MEQNKFEHLPRSVIPTRYAICLTLDFDNFIFMGEETIDIDVLQSTPIIKLNSLELDIQGASLVKPSTGEEIKSSSINILEEVGILEIDFGEDVERGTYQLQIKFKGILGDSMEGLYRSKFKNEQGEVVYMAVTQFEATSARKCYPCWDEPDFKAVFDISVICDPGLVALSNMPVKQTTDLGSLVRHDFESTPLMSTYLSAIAVGDYAYIEDKTAEGIVIRLYAPKPKINYGAVALAIAVKVLTFLKDYFNIPYPLPKLDLIVVEDFSAGAMENWGLVTFRCSALLYDPENTTTFRKRYIYKVVAHELSHQWFGNLVTMKWWTHLWLNEGYATFMERLSIDHLYKELNIWSTFLLMSYTSALKTDSLKTSHPIEVEVGNPSEVDEIFDIISYFKGASILRMLHHYIGDCNFRKGMYIYLTKFKYKNTETEDLWAALEVGCRKPIKKIMSTWTKQTGYPVITVSSESQGDGLLLKFEQRRFLTDPRADPESTLWCVPITVCTSESNGQEVAEYLLEAETGELLIPKVGPNCWIKVNPQLYGFYRVNYDSAMLEKLKEAIVNKSLHSFDRLGIIDDLFALSKAGVCSTVEFLKMVKIYKDETEGTVWRDILACLRTLSILLNGTDCNEDLKVFCRNLLGKIKEDVGWDPKPDESCDITTLRPVLLATLINFDDEDTIREGKSRFQKHIGPGPLLETDLKCVGYVAAAKSGFPIEKLFEMQKATDSAEEKYRILEAISFSNNPKATDKLLELMKSDDIRNQDKYMIFLKLANTGDQEIGDKCWKFFVENDEYIRKILGYFMGSCITGFSFFFSSFEKADMIESYFKEHPHSPSQRAIEQLLESIRISAQWLKKDYRAIDRYFRQCLCSMREE